MDEALLPVLKDAMDKRQRKETFEQALGKAVRRHELDFKVYIDMMSELRERARSTKQDFESVAKKLLAERGKDP